MSVNPNTFEYFIRNGTIILPGTLGNVAGTGDFEYWARNGAILYPVAIPPSGSTSASVYPTVASVSVVAYNAAANVRPNAGHANGTWTADAQVVIGEIANAGNAGVTVHALNPAASVKTHGGLSTATWAANGAAASVRFAAGHANVTVAGNLATANVQPHANVATGNWASYGASVKTSASVFPGVATVTATAYGVSTPSPPAPPQQTTARADGGGGPPTIIRRKPPDTRQPDDHKPRVPKPVPLSLSAQYDALLEFGEITEDEWIGLYMIHGVMP